MNKKNRAPYCKPSLTVVTCKVERGFALSIGVDPEQVEQDLLLLGLNDGDGNDMIESFDVYNDWGSDESSNHFF